MRDLSELHLSVGGHPIASMVEIQTLVYEVPEAESPPSVINEFAAGVGVDPEALFRALDGEVRRLVAQSDRALEVIETLKVRLLQAFPELDLRNGPAASPG